MGQHLAVFIQRQRAAVGHDGAVEAVRGQNGINARGAARRDDDKGDLPRLKLADGPKRLGRDR